jgi:DNA-binding response OmpR family regulator
MAAILIVEDEADLRELYRLALEAAGHVILGCTENPEEPLRSDPSPRAPDLVILDERLGSRSGSEYLARFRAAFPGARMLLVTADPEAIQGALRRGFDIAARKPITLCSLVEEVDTLLGGS